MESAELTPFSEITEYAQLVALEDKQADLKRYIGQADFATPAIELAYEEALKKVTGQAEEIAVKPGLQRQLAKLGMRSVKALGQLKPLKDVLDPEEIDEMENEALGVVEAAKAYYEKYGATTDEARQFMASLETLGGLAIGADGPEYFDIVPEASEWAKLEFESGAGKRPGEEVVVGGVRLGSVYLALEKLYRHNHVLEAYSVPIIDESLPGSLVEHRPDFSLWSGDGVRIEEYHTSCLREMRRTLENEGRLNEFIDGLGLESEFSSVVDYFFDLIDKPVRREIVERILGAWPQVENITAEGALSDIATKLVDSSGVIWPVPEQPHNVVSLRPPARSVKIPKQRAEIKNNLEQHRRIRHLKDQYPEVYTQIEQTLVDFVEHFDDPNEPAYLAVLCEAVGPDLRRQAREYIRYIHDADDGTIDLRQLVMVRLYNNEDNRKVLHKHKSHVEQLVEAAIVEYWPAQAPAAASV